MNRSFVVLVVAASVALTLLSLRLAAQPEATVSGLPGARPMIDASRYPSLQAAFDAIPPEGGIIQLPAGEFEIDEPLRIRNQDVLLRGAGTATHLKNVNIHGQPALIVEHSLGARGREHELWRIGLSDFRVSGNTRSGPGIVLRSINELVIERVSVSHHGDDGIVLDHCYEDPRLCNNLVTYNQGSGLTLIGCHDIVVAANQFEENRDAVRCLDGFNLCLTGNCIDDHLRHGVVIENSYGSVVSGNMIEECQGTAVILDRDCYGIAISANVIAHNGAGIDLRDAHGCAVGANTLTINKERAVRIGPQSGRITLVGNSFSSSYVGEGLDKRAADDRSAAGLVLDGTSDVAISGNVFSGLTSKALQATDTPSARVLFADNLLTDVSSDHAELTSSVVADNLEP